MVCHVDHGLFRAARQLCLILHPQHRDALPTLLLLSSRVHNTRLHGPRKPLVAILARQAEPDTLAALAQLALGPTGRDLPLDAHGLGPVPHALAPPLGAPVQVVGPIVRGEWVGRAAVEGLDGCAGDAVGDAADGGAKVWAVVGRVVGLRGEALHDVVACDGQRLQDRAEGEEGDFVGGHVYCHKLYIHIKTVDAKEGGGEGTVHRKKSRGTTSWVLMRNPMASKFHGSNKAGDQEVVLIGAQEKRRCVQAPKSRLWEWER